jgi:3-oxoacyl-[acyl-carrier protein] reductase
MRLGGSAAIVTGAGRGIGRAIALAFAAEGASVVVAARTAAEVQETARLARDLGRRAVPVIADVSQPEAAERITAAALHEFGTVDILVNNAGVPGPIGPLIDLSRDEWLEAIAINLGGVFLCTRSVLPIMVQRGAGKIINLSGGGATSGRPYFTAYAAAKAAVVRLTESLAQEVQRHNIQVNAIAPGAVNTRMTDAVLAAGRAAGAQALAEARRVKETGGAPIEGVTDLAVFLASRESDGLTGRLISAVWDDWKALTATRIEQIVGTDLYTLRRVDRINA